MKKSNGIIKLVLFIVVVGILSGFGYYYFFLRDTEQPGGGIFPSLSSDKVNDYKNGIYSYKTKTDRTVNLLKHCVIDSINDYLVVINEDYYVYHGNCLNMVFVTQGKTESLKFEKDNSSNYYVKFDDKTYNKDNTVKEIVVANNVLVNEKPLTHDSLKSIVKYSEYPGFYYNFNGSIASNDSFRFEFTYSKETNTFRLDLYNNNVHYIKDMKNLDQFPYFAILNTNLVVLDKNKIGNGYKSELYIYSEANKTYDYNSILPLSVNGNIIDASWNRIFRYDGNNKTAYVLFSKTDNVCDFSNNNVFYEFKMNYDYTKVGFKTPDLYRKGSTEKDCDYVKKYYLN